MKKALIAASYGSGDTEVLKKSVLPFAEALGEAFPEYDVKMAYTGSRTREIMIKQGHNAPSVEEVLRGLLDEGYVEAAIQPSHIVGGDEYHSICDTAQKYSTRFTRVTVGAPLLHSPDDLRTICRMFNDELTSGENEIVLMGHGTEHSANRTYRELDELCREMGYAHIHIATLEASPGLDDLLPALSASGKRKVTLAPLLFSAGTHACRDMAGDGPESWKSRLTERGFDVVPVIKGLGEYDTVRQLYVAHMAHALENK